MGIHEFLQKPTYRAVQVTITGEGGVGKTSLAAAFPSPVFIRTEDGMESLGDAAPESFPVVDRSDYVLEQMGMLLNEGHSFRTVVIDSVTKLNILIEREVIEADPKKPASINQANGGYGAGLAAVAERHRQIKAKADELTHKKGMNVVFIAHADSEIVELPDQDPYTRYTMRMNKRSVTHYADDVDIVAFVKLQMVTSGSGERKRAHSTGTRIITCYPTPNHISKNRYGIAEDLEFAPGTNPFVDYIPVLRNTQTTESTTEEVA